MPLQHTLRAWLITLGNILLALASPLLCVGGIVGLVRLWRTPDFLGIVSGLACFVGFAFSAIVMACVYQTLWNNWLGPAFRRLAHALRSVHWPKRPTQTSSG